MTEFHCEICGKLATLYDGGLPDAPVLVGLVTYAIVTNSRFYCGEHGDSYWMGRVRHEDGECYCVSTPNVQRYVESLG